MWHIFNGKLIDLKKEAHSELYDIMDKPWGHHAMRNKTDKQTKKQEPRCLMTPLIQSI